MKVLRWYKSRSGFGQWSIVIVAECENGHETRVRKSWHGPAPIGAIRCAHATCNALIDLHRLGIYNLTPQVTQKAEYERMAGS